MSELDLDELANAYNRALALEKAGNREAAVSAYRRVLELDPDDRGGVVVRLASLGADVRPDKAPDAYVATLFTQQAPDFDDILVEQLGYDVPMILRAWLMDQAPGPHGMMLDLGCGTGLAGLALRDITDYRVGVDLAEGMLVEADERGCYQELYQGEAVEFLQQLEPEGFDLIVATDVLPYIGNIEPFMGGVAEAVMAGGLVCFSTESLGEDIADSFAVGIHQRFAHRERYVRAVADAFGLTVRAVETLIVRHEEGLPVPGHLVVLEKP